MPRRHADGFTVHQRFVAIKNNRFHANWRKARGRAPIVGGQGKLLARVRSGLFSVQALHRQSGSPVPVAQRIAAFLQSYAAKKAGRATFFARASMLNKR